MNKITSASSSSDYPTPIKYYNADYIKSLFKNQIKKGNWEGKGIIPEIYFNVIGKVER